jgi:hypothetical protein
LQVDSSLMAMLQRPRGSAVDGAGSACAGPGPGAAASAPAFRQSRLGAGLAAHVSHLLAGGGHEALIRLAPDEFGMLEVRVTLHDGQVNVASRGGRGADPGCSRAGVAATAGPAGSCRTALNDASIVSQLARAVERPGGCRRGRRSRTSPGDSEAAGRPSVQSPHQAYATSTCTSEDLPVMS